jgi:hypothetical protein
MRALMSFAQDAAATAGRGGFAFLGGLHDQQRAPGMEPTVEPSDR